MNWLERFAEEMKKNNEPCIFMEQAVIRCFTLFN